jgi:hypothetical protein
MKITTIAIALAAVAIPLLVIPGSAMAWPYYGVGDEEGWHGGGGYGYHGSWGFHGPYCGYPLAEPCWPQVAPVPVPVPVPVAVPAPVPVPVPVPVNSCCGCGCGGTSTTATSWGGIGGTSWYPPQTAYAQTAGQSLTQVNNVSDSPGAYVSNNGYQSQGQYAYGQGG